MNLPALTFRAGDERWWWYAGAAVAAALIVKLYAYERTLVSPRIGRSLLTLRLLAVAILLMILLEPVLLRTSAAPATGRILIAVDLSDSMQIRDTHASRAEKLRLARGLGMIGNSATAPRLDEWTRAFEAGREPEWVGSDEQVDPAVRAGLARVRRDNLNESLSQVDLLTRAEIAQRLLASGPRSLLADLQALADVQLVLFAGKARSAPWEALSQPGLHTTSLLTSTTSLSEVLRISIAESGTAFRGVILLTDGRDTSGHDPLPLARQLGQVQIPILALTLGSTKAPRDLSIGVLDYPDTVARGDHLLLKATLNAPGFEGRTVEVTLRSADGTENRKQVVPAGPEVTVEFEIEADQPGRHQYTLSVTPQSGEARQDNNTRTIPISVTDIKRQVLLIDGAPRWEFRYIDNALRRDPGVRLQSIVFDQPSIGRLSERTFASSLPVATMPEDSAEPTLGEAEVVIIGDVSPAQLTARNWALLEKFVAERGGTLVLCAGKQSLVRPLESPLIEHLLPVVDLQTIDLADTNVAGSPDERGFHLRLTADGEREPMLQFDIDGEANRRLWKDLPGHTWGISGQPKPGAIGLATAVRQADQPADNNPAADRPVNAASLDRERKEAVIVRQNYGLGQVLWIGIDSTWRWRHRVGDRFHHRFWGQLVRWGAGRQMPPDPVSISPKRQEPSAADADRELHDVRTDLTLLDQLATASGGRRLAPDEVGRIPGLLQPQRTGQTTEDRPAWPQWLGLVLLFTLLTAEWTLRKVNGLP